MWEIHFPSLLTFLSLCRCLCTVDWVEFSCYCWTKFYYNLQNVFIKFYKTTWSLFMRYILTTEFFKPLFFQSFTWLKLITLSPYTPWILTTHFSCFFIFIREKQNNWPYPLILVGIRLEIAITFITCINFFSANGIRNLEFSKLTIISNTYGMTWWYITFLCVLFIVSID